MGGQRREWPGALKKGIQLDAQENGQIEASLYTQRTGPTRHGNDEGLRGECDGHHMNDVQTMAYSACDRACT